MDIHCSNPKQRTSRSKTDSKLPADCGITPHVCKLYSQLLAWVSNVFRRRQLIGPPKSKPRRFIVVSLTMTDHPKPLRLSDPEVLIFETSPFGTLDAIVQHDGLSVYFYLNQPQESGKFGTRACWVRNLQIGPLVINEDEMREGISPQLPRTQCVNREGQPIPEPEELSIVWFEEGNGAALIETRSGESKTLAIIPPWSGLEGFNGYAAECATESKICWPMPENPKLEMRIDRAKNFWASISDSNSESSFAKLQSSLLRHYESRFNQGSSSEPEYFSIDGGRFPPRGLIHLTKNSEPKTQTEKPTESNSSQANESIILTVGMSFCPQPAVEIFSDNPTNHRRVELGIQLRGVDEEKTQLAIKQISSLAGYPWRNFTWLSDGHTCEFKNVFPDCENALLVHDSHLNPHLNQTPEKPELLLFRDDPVNLLWLIPILNEQLEELQTKTLSADQVVSNYFQNS